MFTEMFDDWASTGEEISCETLMFKVFATLEPDEDEMLDPDCYMTELPDPGLSAKEFDAQARDYCRWQITRERWDTNDWFYVGVVLTVVCPTLGDCYGDPIRFEGIASVWGDAQEQLKTMIEKGGVVPLEDDND